MNPKRQSGSSVSIISAYHFRLLGAVLLLFGVLPGCAGPSSAGGGGGDEPPVIGTEGGACRADGTCDQGLACVEDVCTPAGDPGGDGEPGEVAEPNDEGPSEGDAGTDGPGEEEPDPGDETDDPGDGEGADDGPENGGQEDGAGDEGDGSGEGDGAAPDDGTDDAKQALLIFHNNSGPMCLEALDWLEIAQEEYADLVVEEHLTTDSGEVVLLRQFEAEYEASEGVSDSFAYLPVIFFEDRAFSGFDDWVQDELQALIEGL